MSGPDRLQKPALGSFVWRMWFVAGVLMLSVGGRVARAVHLQVFNTEFLHAQAAGGVRHAEAAGDHVR